MINSKNFKEFVKSKSFDELTKIVDECPQDKDTYLKSNNTYFSRSKMAYYSSDEINIEDLKYVVSFLNNTFEMTTAKDKIYFKKVLRLMDEIDRGE